MDPDLGFRSLPVELQSYILSYVSQPDKTSLVSHHWETITKRAFGDIFRSYEQSPFLKDYVAKVSDQEGGDDVNRVREVYQALFQEANQLGLILKNKKPNLSIAEMEKIAAKVKGEKNRQFLNFFSQATKGIPEIETFLDSLKDFPIRDKVTAIKKWMSQNPSLLEQVTSIKFTGLFFLPEEIGYFTNLTDLILSGNFLTTLPESIGTLRCLEKLDLSSNQIDSLPDSCGNLQNLSELLLRHNKLTALPLSISNIRTLSVLDIRENFIKEVSPNFRKNNLSCRILL